MLTTVLVTISSALTTSCVIITIVKIVKSLPDSLRSEKVEIKVKA